MGVLGEVHQTTSVSRIPVWTGSRFLYVENTTNVVSAAGPAGMLVHKFASLPKMSEETRCVVSRSGHGFPAHLIYCHTPDNKIYRLSRDGTSVSVFATLPNNWILRPRGRRFQLVELATDLPPATYNLEAVAYVPSQVQSATP